MRTHISGTPVHSPVFQLTNVVELVGTLHRPLDPARREAVVEQLGLWRATELNAPRGRSARRHVVTWFVRLG